jgi:ABC-type multidrug transport system ATPase subunit
MRFYDVQGGRILVDGVDITALRRGDLRRMFGMVLQDTWLFNGTIRENIAYGRENASEEQIVAAARAAQADHFIRTLPESYNTVLNQEASNISQGQKQLLTIARAFLADPEFLILDEATSSVDTRTEILIQRAMSELMKGRTSFVIAHRLSTIRDADLILVMDHGRIVEQGTHEGLLAKGGFYADLYNSQFTARVPNPLPPSLGGKGPHSAISSAGEVELVTGNGHVVEDGHVAEVATHGHVAANGHGTENGHAGSNGHVSAPTERPVMLERRVFARPPAPVHQEPIRREEPVGD